MIISKNVKVKPNNKSEYYRNLGYEIIRCNEEIEIDIKDLPLGSNTKIEVECDRCGIRKIISYEKYNKNIKNGGYYSCSFKCSNDKAKTTFNEKYGVNWSSKSEKWRCEILNKKKDKSLKKYEIFFKNSEFEFKSHDIDNNIIEISHKICDNISLINRYLLNKRIVDKNSLCTHCYPIGDNKSIKEKELINWIKSLNISFIESDKTILKPKHLDIYIPSYNLGIEMNGLYHHSEIKKDKNYHLEKSLKCLEQGIQLLHIWEDEWVLKKDIVKSIILNKLNKIENRIYARQCEIRVIEDSKLVREFLDTNHIQGYCQSSIKLGLYHKNELVSLMTFGYRHTNAKKEFELIRFCNKINLNVIGSASKLFNYFKQNYHFNNLISYSDFRLFDGKMYKTLSFTKQHLSKPDYFWCKNLERKHRFNFNKQKLIKDGFDSSKTEVEIMHERGYYRIFGCGQYRWIYRK